MNIKSLDPRDLVVGLLDRSICNVQVAAVLSDRWGIYAWGWNHMGLKGEGEHAEAFCLRRANRSRLPNSTLWVASKRARNGKITTARPCEKCQPLVKSVSRVVYRDSRGEWVDFS